MDGNTAAAHVAYAYTEVASIFPITPSSTMAELVDEWSARGKKNIFGDTVDVVEMQSELGAAGSFHGSLQGGALTTTFTASQGLLLMIPTMYKVSGELLPGVFHVSARALAAQALSIFGDHQDVMATRQTGCVLLSSHSVQEVADLSIVAHLGALRGRLPFVHFFDGFRTSHEIQKIEVLEDEDYKNLFDMNDLKKFRENALSPSRPVTRGTAQNPDIYFQTREACNPYYDQIIPVVEEMFDKVYKATNRKYGLFDYYGDPNATHIIIAMGSVTQTIEETVDYLNQQGNHCGVVKVHLYRPFSVKHLLDCLPTSVERIAVLDRTKEPGAIGEPLYLDVCAAVKQWNHSPCVVGGRYGLGSKDTTSIDIALVFDNLKQDQPKNHFTIGICDDVTNTSLSKNNISLPSFEEGYSCKIWGLGSDGTIGANKQAIKLIGNETNQYVQAYFDYDSKKSGGLTQSHLRISEKPIRSTYLVHEADYVACHNPSYVFKYDMLDDLKEDGIFVLNCQWDENQLKDHLPLKLKKMLFQKKAQFYTINAIGLAQEIGLGSRINMIMQGVFFELTNILPREVYLQKLLDRIQYMYGKKGESVVSMNQRAVQEGIQQIHKVEVTEDWLISQEENREVIKEPEFVEKIMRPMEALQGNELPVSAFSGREDGTFPCGTSAYEKRGIAIYIPEWITENCIQCNQCSFICPHSCIRPFLLDEDEKKKAPESFVTKKALGKTISQLEYRIQVSPMDCTGCGNCADICPAKDKALEMKPFSEQVDPQSDNWAYAIASVTNKGHLTKRNAVKDSQFYPPYMEFSGACAGCGETAYIKVLTQLYGERMMIANATGCSSIWAASAPSTAYTIDHHGHGPSWANSLFEDNAEYGYGMYLAVRQIRRHLKEVMLELVQLPVDDVLREHFEDWIQYEQDGEVLKEVCEKIIRDIEHYESKNERVNELIEEIRKNSDYLMKRSIWILGGDGWAYDIGFSGLDHVLASGDDVNILVFDTEIYSNTGGQSSKSTPIAAIAKFAAGGKRIGKKDLGRMMMTYGNVYVAQVGMHADNAQLMKAFTEAEQYKGPSIVLAYAPCISHGLKKGMGRSMENIKEAVNCGYWHLYRYNPERKKEGLNPMQLDSKEPKLSFREFIEKQVRYTALIKQNPTLAEELFSKAELNAREKYEILKMMSEES